jgi:flagellar FliL protein
MSTATATEAPAAAKGGKKKLIIIIAAAALLLAVAGGGTVFWLKKKQAAELAAAEAEAEAADADAPAGKAHAKRDPKAVPSFAPLDPFTVNLADREAERYAQIGITLELADAKVADQVKTFMPAIRNNILMVLSHKTSTELLEREGKTKLAEEVLRETSRAMGYDVPEPEPEAAKGDDEAQDEAPRKKKRKKAAPAEPLPIVAVHFSNFIIQ